ncbi:MAG: membrane protein insertion efficiency factor YidD [Hellea sp.]|jgi:putative component of membrane protein insertase Oxa1/YidC/SpoIIIJ protein YidD|nr:membrane protein insertion efficiency factor YidD [Hellea sp.]
MVRLLNLSLSFILVRVIRLYQKFISNRISRNCIYEITCSHRAVEILDSDASIIKKYKSIRKQISSCKIVEIIILDDNSWKVINGHGDPLSPIVLNKHTQLDIHSTLKPFKS